MSISQLRSNNSIFRSIFLAVIVSVMPMKFCLGQSPSADSQTSSDLSIIPDITITVHADQPTGKLTPIWSYFGYDEANYTYSSDGDELLAKLAILNPQPVYIRSHHLLTSGNGQTWLKWSSTGIYNEDPQGNAIYDWSTIDRIFDTLQRHKLKPYVEMGFMPQALTVHPGNYTPPKVLHGKPRDSVGGGAFYPPKDYAKWQTLIETWVRHCVQRYGKDEVLSWYWELWNEPDITYWKGSREEFFKLYDYTAAAVKNVLPAARFGGPHVTNPTGKGSEEFLRKFLEHCLGGKNHVTGKTGAPLDLIAFHTKGGTRVVNGHVRMNAANHLRTIDRGCAIVASYPQFKHLPLIIGESDPDGCAACSSEFYPQNAYRNGTQYASYTAATFMREQAVAERHGVNLQGALTWAFAFPDQPWFAGFRTLSTHGVAKPVLNAFRMFSMLESQRLKVENSSGRTLGELMSPQARATTDIDAVATRSSRAISVIIWHHHDDNVPGPARSVELVVTGLPQEATQITQTHYRIDEHHSNAYSIWRDLGSPQNPTAGQITLLKQSSELTHLQPKQSIAVSKGQILVYINLSRHAISLVRLEW